MTAIHDADPVLRVKGLHVGFDQHAVLRDVSIEVSPGETLVIIGESGCGKTVLLKTLIGLINPSEGAVEHQGRRLDSLGDRELTRLRTRFGFVFQNAALFDSATVADNVAFPLLEHRRMGASRPTVRRSSGWRRSVCRRR